MNYLDERNLSYLLERRNKEMEQLELRRLLRKAKPKKMFFKHLLIAFVVSFSRKKELRSRH